jgi:hypothetical protein
MAVVATDPPLSGALLTRARVAQALLALAVLLAVAKPALPEGLVRLPEGMILPWDLWLQALFDFISDDLGLIHVTRFLTDMLEVVLDATANLLHGKRRWPYPRPDPMDGHRRRRGDAGLLARRLAAGASGRRRLRLDRAGRAMGAGDGDHGGHRRRRARPPSPSASASASSPGSARGSTARCSRCWRCCRRCPSSPISCPR